MPQGLIPASIFKWKSDAHYLLGKDTLVDNSPSSISCIKNNSDKTMIDTLLEVHYGFMDNFSFPQKYLV